MTETTEQAVSANLVTVELGKPIKRGQQEITNIQLREPNAGEMRGLSMVDVAKLETDTIIKLIPRISIPPLLADEVGAMAPNDFFAVATEVANFLLPAGMRQESSPT
ncbi:MAG: phage tail assembly protein [Novosphingobium sp.]|nr:phage tail assembly protein [Novosphingobium sp.]